MTASGAGSAHGSDAADVATLLGRAPFTRYRVAVRCPHGGPAILENEPIDLHGRPFPTRFWLACRALGEAVSRLEAAGGVKRLEGDVDMRDALREANARHAAMHDGRNVGGTRNPDRVKCLHAHLAFGLAVGGNPISEWILREADARWPDRCCLEADDAGE